MHARLNRRHRKCDSIESIGCVHGHTPSPGDLRLDLPLPLRFRDLCSTLFLVILAQYAHAQPAAAAAAAAVSVSQYAPLTTFLHSLPHHRIHICVQYVALAHSPVHKSMMVR